VAKSRGRPTIKGRDKTIAKHYRTNQRVACIHSGSHDHNIADCVNKHLAKSNFHKKPRNNQTSGLKKIFNSLFVYLYRHAKKFKIELVLIGMKICFVQVKVQQEKGKIMMEAHRLNQERRQKFRSVLLSFEGNS
jgi:hypothetical protein